jgi:hypothetical protein
MHPRARPIVRFFLITEPTHDSTMLCSIYLCPTKQLLVTRYEIVRSRHRSMIIILLIPS